MIKMNLLKTYLRRSCSICLLEKPLPCFNKLKHGKYSTASWCKECSNARNAAYYQENIVRERAKRKEYDDTHAEKRQRRHKKNKIRNNAKARQHYQDHKAEISEYARVNRDKHRKQQLANHHRKYATDPLYKITVNIRNLIRISFKNKTFKKHTKSSKILGCTYEEFAEHLLVRFEPGWNWENHGTVWHIDHIIPMATAKTEEDVIRLSHYTNLQPLSREDNLAKGSRLDWQKIKQKPPQS